jgi:hypothetical protein
MGAAVAPDMRNRIHGAASDFVDQVPNRVGKSIERKRATKAAPKKKSAAAGRAKAKARRR